MTRVVVLVSGGNHVSNYFNSKSDAQEFIRSWAARTEARIASKDASVETYLLTDSGKCNMAILNQCVMGMYIPNDGPTVQDKMAAAVERMAGSCCEGDEWKGQ